MAKNIVSLPFDYFGNPSIGRPLFNATVTVGEPDLDPTENKKTLTAIQEDGTEVPISNPYKTGPGGYATLNGDTVTVIVDGNYSMLVQNNLGAQVYLVADRFSGEAATKSDLIQTFNIVQNMIDADTIVGQIATTNGYKTIGDGGAARYRIVDAGTGTADNFIYIDLSTHQAEIILGGEYRCLQGGVSKLNTDAENSLALQSVANAASGGVFPMVVEDEFTTDSQISFSGDATLIFRGGSLTLSADIDFFIINSTVDAIFTVYNLDISSSLGGGGININTGIRGDSLSEFNLLGKSKVVGFRFGVDCAGNGATNNGRFLAENVDIRSVYGSVALGVGFGLFSNAAITTINNLSIDNSSIASGNGSIGVRIQGLATQININTVNIRNWGAQCIAIDPSTAFARAIRINNIQFYDVNSIPTAGQAGCINIGTATTGVVANGTVIIDNLYINQYQGSVLRMTTGFFPNSEITNVKAINVSGTTSSGLVIQNSTNPVLKNIFIEDVADASSNVVFFSNTTNPVIEDVTTESTTANATILMTGSNPGYIVRNITAPAPTPRCSIAVVDPNGLIDLGYDEAFASVTFPGTGTVDVRGKSKFIVNLTAALYTITNANQILNAEEGQEIMFYNPDPVNTLTINHDPGNNLYSTTIGIAGANPVTLLFGTHQTATYVWTAGNLVQVAGHIG